MGGRTHQKEVPFFPDQNVPYCGFHTLAGECGEHDTSHVRILLFSSTQFSLAHTYWFLLCTRQWASHSGVSREKSKFYPPSLGVQHGSYSLYQQWSKYLNSTYVTQNSKHFNELPYLFLTTALYVKNDHYTQRRRWVFMYLSVLLCIA